MRRSSRSAVAAAPAAMPSSTLFLALCTLLRLLPSALASPEAIDLQFRPSLSRRVPASQTEELLPRGSAENPEHVVLADCRDSNGVVSSQMAYFPGAVNATPEDVAVVSTPSGQTALWASMTTSGLFTDTGVTFTAKLGPKVAEGDYAGSGNNGYGSFSCWQSYFLNLYTYNDNTKCSQVYDCNHDPAPAVMPTPLPNTTATPNNNTALPAAHDTGLTVGAEVAVVVGVLAAVGIALAAALFAWVRYRAHRRRQMGLPPSRGLLARCCGGGRAKPAELHGNHSSSPYQGFLSPSQQGYIDPSKYFDPTKKKDGPSSGVPGMGGTVYELDSQYHGVEMHGFSRPGEIDSIERQGELDATSPPLELDTKDRMYAQYMSRRNNVENFTQ